MNRYYFVQNFSKMELLTLTLQQEGGNFHREGLGGGGGGIMNQCYIVSKQTLSFQLVNLFALT